MRSSLYAPSTNHCHRRKTIPSKVRLNLKKKINKTSQRIFNIFMWEFSRSRNKKKENVYRLVGFQLDRR